MTSTGVARPRWISAYSISLLAAAAGALGFATFGLGRVEPWIFTVALVLLTVAELGEAASSGFPGAGAAVDVVGVMGWGAAGMAWADVISVTVVQGLVKRRPIERVARHAAFRSLTTLMAGASFRLSGGHVGMIALPHDLWPMLGCAATFFLAHAGTASIEWELARGDSAPRSWPRLFAPAWLEHLSLLALGCVATLLAVRGDPWAIGLIALPWIGAQRSIARLAGIRGDLKALARALAEVLDEVDPYTRQHSVRVAEYAARLARSLGCSGRQVEDIECAALVHDLGKIGPQHQRILQKPGSLTHEDQRTLRGHPAVGAGIIGKVKALRRSAEVVRLHHERPDGRGYPLGLRGEEIPLGARILNVADAFDAMTSDRPYRDALDVDRAIDELVRGSGSQFDPRVVERLVALRAAGRFPKIESPSGAELRLLRVHSPQVRT